MNWTTAVRSFSSSFFSWLYPGRCALCGVLGDSAICSICLQDFDPVDRVSRSYDGGALELVATVYPYSGRVGQAVRRLKYARATSLADPLSEMLSAGVERMGLSDYDWVVPIPIHWSRRCSRGFNQSDLLAAGLERVESSALRRIRRTRPQARLSRQDRLHNLAGAFRASGVAAGKSVLLVDDVLTSGETALECAKALAAAGAGPIAAIALAGEPAWMDRAIEM